MSLSFKPVSDGLYSAVVEAPQKVALYWLLLDGSPPAGNVDVSDTWRKYSGAYVFVPPGATIADTSKFVSALKGVFTPIQETVRWISWISDTANPSTTAVVNIKAIFPLPSSTAAQMSVAAIPLANVELDIPNLSTIALDGGTTDAPQFAIKSSSDGVISFKRSGHGGTLTPAEETMNVLLSGTTTGALSFNSKDWDRGTFYQFFTDNPSGWETTFAANEVRFFHGPDFTTATPLRYPVFKPEAVSEDPTQVLFLAVTLDPLNVWDGARTQFLVDVAAHQSSPAKPPVSNYFYATNGKVLQLTPHNNNGSPAGGYAFGRRPKGESPGDGTHFCYLTPIGKFDTQIVADDGNPSETAGGGIGNFLCGLTGTEFLMVAPTATVEFVNQQAAYTKQFTPPSGGSSGSGSNANPCSPGDGRTPVDPDSPLLEDKWTTSWLQINQPTTKPAPPIYYGYVVQPEAAVYYSSVTKPGNSGDDYPYPMALSCRVSEMTNSGDGAPTLVPMVAYGGLPMVPQNQQALTDVVKAFESQIVASTRYDKAPKDMIKGPTFFDPVTHEPCSGKARTPEGLLVELNDNEGTWKTLHLANSPDIADTDPPPVPGASRLAFDAVPPETNPKPGDSVISPVLSNALMNDKLFMVVTNPAALGKQLSALTAQTNPTKAAFAKAVTEVMEGKPGAVLPPGRWFENEIQMGEWTFRLDVGPNTVDEDPRHHTILIFKFTTGLSVVDLVANAAYWQYWKGFIDGGTAADVKNVQARLNELLCVANKDNGQNKDYGGAVFDDFWAKATDPDWTGILAMNCGLDASDLPIDLQDLLGGINGQLRAHHLGITINQINATKDGVITPSKEWSIDKTSMFALVHYSATYTYPLATQANDDLFQVLKLNALFENSDLVHFDAKIAVTIPKLFDQDVTLTNTAVSPPKPPENPPKPVVTNPNVIEIDGTYQKHGDTGTVVFETTEPFNFTFNKSGSTYRALQKVYVTDAVLVPVSSTPDTTCDGNSSTGTVAVKSNFSLSGLLLFTSPDISTDANADPFSYGQPQASPPTGLPFDGYNIAMCTEIKDNEGTIKQIGPDRSAFRVQPAGATPRTNSVVKCLPLKLQQFVEYSGSSDWPSGWPVEGTGFSNDPFEPIFALQFQVSLGSLGVLSALADSLDVDLILGWKPGLTDSESDTVWLLMVPPKTMLGKEGFGIEGVLATTFTPVSLVSGFWPTNQKAKIEYAIYLQSVQVELLSLSLIPTEKGDDGHDTTQANFTIFSKPGGDGSTSNLGWLATYAKKADDDSEDE